MRLTILSRLVEAVRDWTGRIFNRYASDATPLRPRGSEITVMVNIKTNAGKTRLDFGEVRSDLEFGPRWNEKDEAMLVEAMYRVPVYALAVALVNRVHMLEEYTGERWYAKTRDAIETYYFDTESKPELRKRNHL